MSYTGRLGDIIAGIRLNFNEATAKNVTDAQLLAFVMAAYRELARKGYWRRESVIDAVANDYDYDLSALLTGFNRAHEVWWWDGSEPMEEIANKSLFEKVKQQESYVNYTGDPLIWCVHSNILYVYPTPTENVTDGFRIFDSYYPSALGDHVTTTDVTGSVTTYTKDGTAKGHFNVANSDAVVGTLVVFDDGTSRTIIAKISDGTHTNDLTLSSDHATGTVSYIYATDYDTAVTPEFPEHFDDFLIEAGTHYVFQRDQKAAQSEWWFKRSRLTLTEMLRQNRGIAPNVRPG